MLSARAVLPRPIEHLGFASAVSMNAEPGTLGWLSSCCYALAEAEFAGTFR